MPEDAIALESMNSTLMGIYDAVRDRLEQGSTEAIAETVVALDLAKREIAEMLDQAKQQLSVAMGNNSEYAHAGFSFEKKQGAPRKTWDHNALAGLVSQRLVDLSVDLDTGEVRQSPEELLREMLNYMGISYWRVKELSKIGINADQFCEQGEPKTNIIIKGN